MGKSMGKSMFFRPETSEKNWGVRRVLILQGPRVEPLMRLTQSPWLGMCLAEKTYTGAYTLNVSHLTGWRFSNTLNRVCMSLGQTWMHINIKCTCFKASAWYAGRPPEIPGSSHQMDLGQTGIQCPTGKTSIQIEAKRSHPLQAGIPRSRSRRQRTLLQDHLPREGLLCHRQIFLGPRGGRYVYVTPWGSVERGKPDLLKWPDVQWPSSRVWNTRLIYTHIMFRL